MTREWIPIWNTLRFPVTSFKKKWQKAQIECKTHHHQTKHLGKKTQNGHTDHTQITTLLQVGSNLMNKKPQAQGACTKSVFCRDAEKNPAQSLSFSFPAAPPDSHCHGPGLLPEAHRTCTHGPSGSGTASAGQRLHDNKHVQHKLEGTIYLYQRKIGPEDVKVGACWSSKDHLRSTTILSFAAPLLEQEAFQ